MIINVNAAGGLFSSSISFESCLFTSSFVLTCRLFCYKPYNSLCTHSFKQFWKMGWFPFFSAVQVIKKKKTMQNKSTIANVYDHWSYVLLSKYTETHGENLNLFLFLIITCHVLLFTYLKLLLYRRFHICVIFVPDWRTTYTTHWKIFLYYKTLIYYLSEYTEAIFFYPTTESKTVLPTIPGASTNRNFLFCNGA